MAVVLVTEKLADRGLELMRDAGHEVEVRLDLSPEELIEASSGLHALVIRSATQVTAEVLEAGKELVVVGRAGIGLDNVDTAAATRLGVMVVNAPQSNILSAAEHTLALLLAQARNVPQAHAALVAGQVGAVEVGGRRAPRQDPRDRRAREGRGARRTAGARLRDAPRRLRPLRLARPGEAHERRDHVSRGPGRRGRLRHRPPAEDAGDRRG